MNNIEKKLDALIDVLGFDCKEVKSTSKFYGVGYVNDDGSLKDGAIPAGTMKSIDYKVTKKGKRADLVDILGTLQFIDTTIDLTPPAAPAPTKEYIERAISILNRMIEDE